MTGDRSAISRSAARSRLFRKHQRVQGRAQAIELGWAAETPISVRDSARPWAVLRHPELGFHYVGAFAPSVGRPFQRVA